MKLHLLTIPTLVLCLVSFSALQAGDVKITSVHLCCGKCLTAADAALKGVEGVSNAKCDRSSSSVSFTATNDQAAQAGVNALAQAGFGGSARHEGKAVAFPATGAKAGTKANSVTFTGVHLCCGKCVTAAEKALSNVEGVTLVKVDKSTGLVTLTGKDISAQTAAEALLANGFFGKVK